MWVFTRVVLLAGFFESSFAFAEGPLSTVTQVAAGLTHTCAVTKNGRVACWGDNSFGQLGDGTYTSHSRPVYVKTSATDYLDDAIQVAVGANYSCALRSNHSVYCWGNNNLGELGNGATGTTERYPVHVQISEPVSAISSVSEFTCALLSVQHSIRCWGDNYSGQLGDGTKTNRSVPVDVVISETDGTKKLLTGVTQMSAGSDHACAVLDDNTAACWGFNWLGELGNGTFADTVSPVAVVITKPGMPRLHDIEQITANGTHTCAKFASTWQLACWGNNAQGQLGDPEVTFETASPVGVAVGVHTVGAGQESTCAMLADGRVACWGGNYYGQLGNGTTTSTRTPIISSIAKISSLSVGAYHVCAVMPDTTVQCWGEGRSGQIGDGLSSTTNPSPRLVVGP